jgi:hypothetical protein
VIYYPKPCLSVHVRSLQNTEKETYFHQATLKQGKNGKFHPQST